MHHNRIKKCFIPGVLKSVISAIENVSVDITQYMHYKIEGEWNEYAWRIFWRFMRFY